MENHYIIINIVNNPGDSKIEDNEVEKTIKYQDLKIKASMVLRNPSMASSFSQKNGKEIQLTLLERQSRHTHPSTHPQPSPPNDPHLMFYLPITRPPHMTRHKTHHKILTWCDLPITDLLTT